MKSLRILTLFLLSMVIFTACEKDEKTFGKNSGNAEVEAKDYVFNTATKQFVDDGDININVKSQDGVKSIYAYLLRTGKADSVVHIYIPGEEDNPKDLTYKIEATSFIRAIMFDVTGIKLMIRGLNNSGNEHIINVSSYTPAVPSLSGLADKLIAENNKITITGVAKSDNGLQKIEIQDDAEVTFKTIHTVEALTGTSYNLSYEYTLRTGVKQIRVILTDDEGYTAQKLINVEATAVTGPFKKYENVILNAQGFETGNAFIAQTGTLLGACDLPTRGVESDIILYVNSGGVVQIYASGNAGNIVSNYRCNDIPWALQPGETLKATKLRILDPGNTAQKRVIDAYANNSITDMSMAGIFAGASLPSANTATFNHATSTNFDLTTRSLIWLLIPGSTPKNALLKIKSVTADGPNTTITMDILVEN